MYVYWAASPGYNDRHSQPTAELENILRSLYLMALFHCTAFSVDISLVLKWFYS
jgi:hypothetical protein